MSPQLDSQSTISIYRGKKETNEEEYILIKGKRVSIISVGKDHIVKLFSYCAIGFTPIGRLKTSSTFDGEQFGTFSIVLVFQIFKNTIDLYTFHICRSKD